MGVRHKFARRKNFEKNSVIPNPPFFCPLICQLRLDNDTNPTRYFRCFTYCTYAYTFVLVKAFGRSNTWIASAHRFSFTESPSSSSSGQACSRPFLNQSPFERSQRRKFIAYLFSGCVDCIYSSITN